MVGETRTYIAREKYKARLAGSSPRAVETVSVYTPKGAAVFEVPRDKTEDDRDIAIKALRAYANLPSPIAKRPRFVSAIEELSSQS